MTMVTCYSVCSCPALALSMPTIYMPEYINLIQSQFS